MQPLMSMSRRLRSYAFLACLLPTLLITVYQETDADPCRGQLFGTSQTIHID